MPSHDRPGPVERLEASRPGRLVISLGLIAVLLAILVGNLPDSLVKREAGQVTDRYLFALGLDQVWGVFAPDPRKEVLYVEGRLAFSGAETTTWRPPEQGPWLGTYRDYRWRKFMENAANEEQRDLHATTADWLIRRYSREGRVPVNVELVRRSYALVAPGRKPKKGLKFTDTRIFQAFGPEKGGGG